MTLSMTAWAVYFASGESSRGSVQSQFYMVDSVFGVMGSTKAWYEIGRVAYQGDTNLPILRVLKLVSIKFDCSGMA
jgi:hypothetical protein